jgi:hypothetical protein
MLADHPEICMSQPKELNYFNWHFDKGQHWYERHFAQPERPIRGELSPRYMEDPRVCQRIANSYPSMKLLVVLRDPYQRALSHLAMDVQNAEGGVSRVPLDRWQEYARKDAKYVGRSLYHQLLAPFFRAFPREQITVLYYEDLQSDFRSFLRSLYRSVGADDTHVPAAAQRKTNQSQDYRSVLLFRVLRAASRCCNAIPLTRWAMDMLYRRTFLRERVIELLMVNAGRPRFDFQQVFGADEANQIAADVQQLHSDLGLTLPAAWHLPSATGAPPFAVAETGENRLRAEKGERLPGDYLPSQPLPA